MAEHIQCRVCDSPYCDGCNNYILSKMLHNGKFDCIMDDYRTIKLSADVVEAKHGEWILTKTEFGWNCAEYPAEYTCSVCGRTEKQQEPYCHCGAKMDGGKHE